jgi:hypothetical protein
VGGGSYAFAYNDSGTVKFWTAHAGNGPFATIALTTWYHVDLQWKPGSPMVEQIWIDGVDQTETNSGNKTDLITAVGFGAAFPGGWETDYELYIRSPAVGTTKGATDVWNGGTLDSGAIGTIFDTVVTGASNTLELISDPTVTSPTNCGQVDWRFLIIDLDGSGITLLDHLASERIVTPKLNEALEVSGTVPSDSDYVNRTHTDGFPLLAEGVRQLYCLRRESLTAPYYTVRASTLLLQVDDAAASDDARTRFTAFDPWQYMFMRPALVGSLTTTGTANTGDLIGPEGAVYDSTVTAGDVATDLINTAIAFADVLAPVAAQDLFLRAITDDGNTATVGADGWEIQQGTSLGQALLDLCSAGFMDIVLTPIYEPLTDPGYLCDLDIMSQSSPYLGAGVFNYNAIFAWDMPGRNVTGIDDLFDGLGRANVIQYYNGQGGPAVTQVTDTASIATYGEYWAQQFFPAQTKASAVVSMATWQLGLRKDVKQTLTVNPAPCRAPEPFVDYGLGDKVPVWASNRLRQPVGDPSGSPVTTAQVTDYQRIYGIPIEIDDNGAEMVRELIVGIVGAAP